MGYHTEFDGEISIEPALNQEEIDYLNAFADSRRMNRTKGPYHIGNGEYGQDHEDDIINYNRPPMGQPGLWCHWIPTKDGKMLVWNGAEKFYDSAEWMQYLIDHFLSPIAIAKTELPFLQANHVLNGKINAQGEEPSDIWQLVVENNVVNRKQGRIVYD